MPTTGRGRCLKPTWAIQVNYSKSCRSVAAAVDPLWPYTAVADSAPRAQQETLCILPVTGSLGSRGFVAFPVALRWNLGDLVGTSVVGKVFKEGQDLPFAVIVCAVRPFYAVAGVAF